VIYRIPLQQGTYDVTLLFAEGCCSEGCEDIADPQLSAGGCRVFDIIVNGNTVADQFAQHVEAQKALAVIDPSTPPLPNNTWVDLAPGVPTDRKSVALAKGPYRVSDTNVIEINIHDLGTGSPPENASIKGIAITPPTGPVENCTNKVDDDGDQLIDCADPDCTSAPSCQGGKKFYRADPNNDGSTNITDGIYILNFLFLGGPAPTCRESADANNDGGINITDGIYVLNYLFLGGPAPSLPGPPGKGNPCGSDPDPAGGPKDLGCAVYDKCPPP